ncbi:MAG: RdgB/HAM1 family non-canonical purine NTP pyrophosphatase [Myxococcota bacterium]
MKIVLASHNAHKLKEIQEILRGSPFEALSLDGFDGLPDDIPEDYDTFEGNALQKARFVFDRIGLTCVADDSGIAVDALNGAPGVHSKRYTPQATAPANNRKLLAELDGVTDRSARFVCVMAVVSAAGERIVRATCEGRIALEPRGDGGFGYDPLFLPEDTPGKTMAELSAAEKNAISHRGRAFAQLPQTLADLRLG